MEGIRQQYFNNKIKYKMKIHTLEEVTNKLIGEKGTIERDLFEYELQMDSIGNAIKQIRKERNLTQEELGELIGVQKSTNFSS